MILDLTAYEKAFAALPENVTAAEVCADGHEELLIRVSGGKQTGSENFSKTTLYLRASGEKTGTVLTERLDDDPYRLMELALDCASYSQAEAPELMNDADNCHIVTGDDSCTAGDILNAAINLEAQAAALPGVSSVTGCFVRKTTLARRVLNSKGLDRFLEHTGYLASISLRASRNGASGPAGSAEAYVDSLTNLNCKALAMKALATADLSDGGGTLAPAAVPSGKYAAVLSNQVTRNIMITAWMSFVRERMESGNSAFPLTSGQMMASEKVSLVDDPCPPSWSVDYRLDSEGTLCQKTDILRNGQLVTPLSTLASGVSSGNAGRIAGLSGTTPINLITIPSCIYIESGDSTVEEMLQQMGDGIYLTYSLDVFHSINIASGEFSIPCGGILYKDGKPVGTADQLTIAGNLRDLFRDVLAVGDDLTLEEFMFYHNYSYGGPSLLVKELSFSSKQE